MTRAERRFPRSILFIFFLLCAPFALGGCGNDAEPFPEPQGFNDVGRIVRSDPRGPILLSFVSTPIQDGSPPDGIRAAMQRSLDSRPCSAATFFWTERDRTRRWLFDQIESRRVANLPVRIILAGHGLGATEACELAKDLMRQYRDQGVEIALLVTVDAVKTNRIGSAAAVTGNALTRRIPGVDHNFTAYDAAPAPDGKRLWAHVNYYQSKTTYYHGTAMPHAENHRLDDWTGLLNHGNVDDFAFGFLVADFRQALQKARR